MLKVKKYFIFSGRRQKRGDNDIMGLDINSPDMPKDGCETVNMVNVNGTYAQPALQFMKRVVDWIYTQPKMFDASKIFLKGFSMSGPYGGKYNSI